MPGSTPGVVPQVPTTTSDNSWLMSPLLQAAMRQQQLLAEQVEERRLARMREQDMTPLEQSLNRGLLPSGLEEKKRGRQGVVRAMHRGRK